MRSISRVYDVSINTVSKLLVDAGTACAAFHDEQVRGVKARRVQVDEIWSFTAAKQKNVPNMNRRVEGAGDTWTWTAIEAETKLLITWFVGGRDSDYAIASWMICGTGSPTGSSLRAMATAPISKRLKAHSAAMSIMPNS